MKNKITWFYIITVLYWIGSYTYPAILPGYVNKITNDLSITGIILSMYGLFQILTGLPFGIASDILGNRKLFTLIGLIALGIGPIILAFSHNAGELLLGRAITGIAAGAWVPLSILILNEDPSNVYKITNNLSVITNFGSILAIFTIPILVSTKFGVQSTFWVASLVSLLAIFILIFLHDETSEINTRFSIKELGDEITNPSTFIPGFLCAIVLFIIFSTTFTFIPLIGENLHLSNNQISAFMIVYFSISMMVNLLIKKILNDKNKYFLGYVSISFLTIGAVLTGLSSRFITLMLAQIIIGIGFGIGYPLFLGFAMEKSKQKSRTISMGIFQSIYSIGMFAGPPVSTRLAEAYGIPAMTGIIGFLVLPIGFLMIYLYRAKTRNLAEE